MLSISCINRHPPFERGTLEDENLKQIYLNCRLLAARRDCIFCLLHDNDALLHYTRFLHSATNIAISTYRQEMEIQARFIPNLKPLPGWNIRAEQSSAIFPLAIKTWDNFRSFIQYVDTWQRSAGSSENKNLLMSLRVPKTIFQIQEDGRWEEGRETRRQDVTSAW